MTVASEYDVRARRVRTSKKKNCFWCFIACMSSRVPFPELRFVVTAILFYSSYKRYLLLSIKD